MRSMKLQGLILILLISCQVFATDYQYFQTNDCQCTCNCQVPVDNTNNGGNTNGGNTNGGNTNGGNTNGGNTNGGNTNGGSTNGGNTNGGSTNGGNTNGGNTSGKQPRDFKAWFANMQKDPWGKSGLPVILSRINGVITQAQGDKWLTDITSAAKAFPDFCNSGNEAKDKQEFAAFMTIIGAETSFDPSNGFPCTKEIGCPNCEACSYNSKGKECASNPDKQYFGRGPLQLSWDYNYINFSKYYFNDTRALDNPNIVTQNEQTCWASAIWFWMTQQGYGGWCMPQAAWPSRDQCSKDCPNGPTGCTNSACTSTHWLNQGKASPHEAIHSGKGMGQVINIINGGYDCCPSTTYFTSYGHTLHRVQWFAEILQLWGEPLPFSNLGTVPIQECPIAEGTIDCSRLTSNTCYWNCCSAKSK